MFTGLGLFKKKKKDFTVVRLYTIIQWGDHETISERVLLLDFILSNK